MKSWLLRLDIHEALVLTMVLVMKVCHVIYLKIVNGSSELENRNTIIGIPFRNNIKKKSKLPIYKRVIDTKYSDTNQNVNVQSMYN